MLDEFVYRYGVPVTIVFHQGQVFVAAAALEFNFLIVLAAPDEVEGPSVLVTGARVSPFSLEMKYRRENHFLAVPASSWTSKEHISPSFPSFFPCYNFF